MQPTRYSLCSLRALSGWLRTMFCMLLLLSGCVQGMMVAYANPAVVALKNNLLYDAVATPNLQVEFRLAEHWSLQAGVGFNPFPLKDEVIPKWRHVYAELAPRYWFCDAYTRDFVSVNIGYTHYNVAGGVYPIGWMYKAVQSNRFQGDAILFGASYGWQFPISPHFSIELEGGVDAGFTWYDRFECVHCGKQLALREKKWFALPRLGVNLVVLLDANKTEFEERCDCGKLHTNENPVEPDTILLSPADSVIIRVLEEPDTIRETIEYVPEDTFKMIDEYMDSPGPRPSRESVDDLRKRILELEKQERRNPSDSLNVVITELIDEQVEVAHLDQMARLRKAILRPVEEFEPYNPEAKVTKEPNSIFMHFDVNVSEVDRSFIHNDELMDSIIQVIDEAMQDPSIEIKFIKIVGMASFDGSRKGNERLAASRAEALMDYVQERLGLRSDMFRVYNGGECWAELRWYLEHEEFEGKADIMCMIDQVLDYDLRERFIKRLNNGRTYEYMRTHFKRYLRNLGTITVYYETKDRNE